MADQSETWQRIGQRMEERFKDLKLSMTEFAERAGVSDTRIRAYFAGTPVKQAAKRRGLCEALEWSRRSIDLMEQGGEPEPLPEPDPEVDRRLSALEAAVADLRTAIRELGTPGGAP